jgi:hypothetical protein
MCGSLLLANLQCLLGDSNPLHDTWTIEAANMFIVKYLQKYYKILGFMKYIECECSRGSQRFEKLFILQSGTCDVEGKLIA